MSLAALLERSKREREDWKYTDLAALLAAPRAPTTEAAPLPASPNATDDAPAAQLVFVNGVWQAKRSRFGTIPSCILMGDAESGYKLTLGEKTCLVAQPLELVFLSDAAAPAEINVKLSIELGANARLTLLERHEASLIPTVIETDIALGERAKFVHGKIVAGGAHLATTRARAASGAYYGNFSLLRGGHPARNEIEVRLIGENAQAALAGAMLGRGAEHSDTLTRVFHDAPHGTSRQVYKTVLADKARGVFQGKIYVAPGAQKTDGYQLSRALLLSDQAEMDAKPELEIYADDVKCSHGCAVGDLDDEAMFYLRSRGLSENAARALLIDAFIGEAFDEIPMPAWREAFRAEAQKGLS